jgi:uncharacterized protein involved in response to NO
MGRSLPLHGVLPQPTSRSGPAIAAKGFRPFFALAAAYAALIVPLWLAIVAAVVRPSAYLDPVSWHAHEMIFGFTVAVIAGFLLTAVANWTQRETLVGVPLLALSGLWLLGRMALLFPAKLPHGLPAALDLAFLPLLVVVLGRPLVASNNRRNFAMLGVLSALFAANVAVHLDALGLLPPGSARRASSVAIDVVVVIVLIVAGRVFPMFTRNATRVSTIRSIPSLDVATVVTMAGLVLADALASEARVVNVLAGIVGLLAAARAVHWGARHAFKEPLLWILHTGYAWLVIGMLLRAAGSFVPAMPSSLSTHALTVGAIGSLTLGMMARVSLGHTGRPLVAPRAIRSAFVAITIAAVARVVAPVFAPTAYFASLIVAGVLWSLAFATFLWLYLPILASARSDGKPG